MCAGKKTLREVEAADLLATLRSEVGQHHRIDELAPERVKLASGREARIEYEEGKPPYIESYLQDFIGTKVSPRAGRVPLVIHLLAPNKRAVQVTSDLAGFWERHYPSIRKELMRKYPRHPWPEDTSTPVPMRPPRRR
jgi:ATP-dependent helicase HrpB